MSEFKRMSVPCEYDAKALDEDGTFKGYGSVFDVVDFDLDVVKQGAFARTLKEWKKKDALPPVVWQHDFRNPIGPHLEMDEDAKGLKLKGLLLHQDVQKAREARALMKHKAVNGLSIGFITKKSRQGKDKDGRAVREIVELDLLEVSIVTLGSNPRALVTDVKGITVDEIGRITSLKDCEEILREAGFSKQAATAFVAKCRNQGEPGVEQAGAKLIATLKAATNQLHKESSK